MPANKKKKPTRSAKKSKASKKKSAKKTAKKSKPSKNTRAKKSAPKKAKKTAMLSAPRRLPSPRPVWEKLLIKGGTLLLANAPTEAHTWLTGAPASVMVTANGDVDTVWGFASDFAELEGKVVPALAQAKNVVIVAYQKGSKELHRDTLWEAMKKHGWEGSTLISVDDTWSAMRCLRAA